MITIDLSKLDQTLDRCDDLANRLMPGALATWLAHTPRRSGHARRMTRRSGLEIQARYEYAEVLDQGRGFRHGQWRGSELAPKGMSGPTREWIEKNAKEQARRLSRG